MTLTRLISQPDGGIERGFAILDGERPVRPLALHEIQIDSPAAVAGAIEHGPAVETCPANNVEVRCKSCRNVRHRFDDDDSLNVWPFLKTLPPATKRF